MSAELILIIEDNELNLKLVRDVLQHQGYRTVEANTARAGLGLALENQPDLIVLDIWLPDLDGIQVLEQLRRSPRTSEIPCMAVTASAMADERARIIGAGFDVYLSKPFHIKEFLLHVQRVLERRHRGEVSP